MYKVLIYDNYSSIYDAPEPIVHRFEDFKSALKDAKGIVEKELEKMYESKITPQRLYKKYISCAEEPMIGMSEKFIKRSKEGDKKKFTEGFSGREYAKKIMFDLWINKSSLEEVYEYIVSFCIKVYKEEELDFDEAPYKAIFNSVKKSIENKDNIEKKFEIQKKLIQKLFKNTEDISKEDIIEYFGDKVAKQFPSLMTKKMIEEKKKKKEREKLLKARYIEDDHLKKKVINEMILVNKFNDIDYNFYIGKYPVTQHEYIEIMGKNPSYYTGKNRPVDQLTFYDAIMYCNKRSKKENLEIAYQIEKIVYDSNNESIKSMDFEFIRYSDGYRLPMEDEWEFAAKGGEKSQGYKYSGSNDLDEVAWYFGNCNSTQEVGMKKENELGLYDMNGNVSEWCWDWYGNSSSKVVQGYSYWHLKNYFKNKRGTDSPPFCKGHNVGFRVVRGRSSNDKKAQNYGELSIKYQVKNKLSEIIKKKLTWIVERIKIALR